MPLLPERTIPYKSWVKTSLVEGLRPVFANHPDTRLRGTKVSIDFPTSELHYPSIVVRFFERSVRNAGVGHVEYLFAHEDDTLTTKFRHYLYDGDIEFAIFALSSLDRDLISDSLIQTLTMPDMAVYTNNFFNRIYFPASTDSPSDATDYNKAAWNYVNLNTDVVSGFGETQTPQPWLSEDQLVYQTSYRVGIYGEFYSLPPLDTVTGADTITAVNIYPYMTDLEPLPEGTNDPSQWE